MVALIKEVHREFWGLGYPTALVNIYVKNEFHQACLNYAGSQVPLSKILRILCLNCVLILSSHCMLLQIIWSIICLTEHVKLRFSLSMPCDASWASQFKWNCVTVMLKGNLNCLCIVACTFPNYYVLWLRIIWLTSVCSSSSIIECLTYSLKEFFFE